MVTGRLVECARVPHDPGVDYYDRLNRAGAELLEAGWTEIQWTQDEDHAVAYGQAPREPGPPTTLRGVLGEIAVALVVTAAWVGIVWLVGMM